MGLTLTSVFFLVVGKSCFHPNNPAPGFPGLSAVACTQRNSTESNCNAAGTQKKMILMSHRSCFWPKRKRSRLTCGVAIMHTCTHTQTHMHMHTHTLCILEHNTNSLFSIWLYIFLLFNLLFIFQVQWYTLVHMCCVANNNLVVIVNLTQARVIQKERENQLRKRFYQTGP